MEKSANNSYIDGVFSFHEGENDFEFIIPTFIDIHCHGGAGTYFSDDPTKVYKFHHDQGTEIQVASLVTSDLPTMILQIEKLKANRDIFGIHLEGPYLSQSYCGAHDPAQLRVPNLREVQSLIDAGDGAIKMMTIAPELENAIEVIEYIVARGVIAAIGHSAANSQQTANAIKAGARVVTHINNGMAKIGADDSLFSCSVHSDLFLELIADRIHVSPVDMKSIINMAPQRIIAITDAMAAAGENDGEYLIGSQKVLVHDGKATLSSNGKLAGSTLTMLQAFLNLVDLAGFESAVRYTSINPAQVLGIPLTQKYIGIRNGQVTYL